MGLLHRGAQPRPIAVAKHWADGTAIVDYHPRLKAVEWIRGKIADEKAGLDPWDPTIFIVVAFQYERVFGYRCLELCGEVLTTADNEDGTRRLRATLAADVRAELELSKPDAPLMLDEPLASRGVGPLLYVVEGDYEPTISGVRLLADAGVELTPGQQALRAAKAAYDKRPVS